MKTHFKNILGLTIAVFFLLTAISCGDDPKPQPEPTKSELIAQNWSLRSVSIGGQPENISGYSIRFQSNGNFNFTTPNVPGLPSSGTWAINASETVIILNGSIELPIRTLTKTNFAFDYTYENHKEGNVTVLFVLGV
ncbi:hypothetical protein [Aquiflexum sp.]|uniref:hypothetical protein n=1 Tax=Aquiflexum sp. TaxID=1872584 RepID=UPI00359443A9